MKRLTLLGIVLLVFFVCAPAFALEERNITNEPTVNKPHVQAPASSATPQTSGQTSGQTSVQTSGQTSVQPSAQGDTAAIPAQSSGNPAEKAFSKTPAPAKGQAQAPATGQLDQWTPPAEGQPANQYPDSGAEPSGSGGDMYHSPEATQTQTYSRKEIDQQVMGFFEGGARGLAELVGKAFERYGEPVGFIKGGEGAGALFVGLRYGEGWLHLKNGQKVYVYWQSPSLGFDIGANLSKVFCLVYGMTNVDQIFQRYPGVNGSAYVVGGFGMTYQRSAPVTLAPIRFGMGLRLGANVGYMAFTREKTINPF